MSIASVAANSAASSTLASGASASSAGSAASNPLGSLSSNFNSFLTMLMTQMRNQDPTSPMDTSQFTTELVQFTSVQQQIQTNSSLTQLINLTQGSSVIQGSAMIGKQVAVTANQLSLQNGAAGLQINAPAAETVNVAITSDTGTPLRTATLSVNKGLNSWTWNGADNNGNTLPDGAYNVAVTANGAAAGNVSVPFNVVGTATGINKSGSALQLNMGALSVDFSAVQSVLNGG